MKTIAYKTTGAALVPGVYGESRLEPIGVKVELPYTPENLERAEAEATPGTLLIWESSDDDELLDVRDRLVLKDRSTEKLFELYVENGKLMMEVL